MVRWTDAAIRAATVEAIGQRDLFHAMPDSTPPLHATAPRGSSSFGQCSKSQPANTMTLAHTLPPAALPCLHLCGNSCLKPCQQTCAYDSLPHWTECPDKCYTWSLYTSDLTATLLFMRGYCNAPGLSRLRLNLSLSLLPAYDRWLVTMTTDECVSEVIPSPGEPLILRLRHKVTSDRNE